MGMCVIYFCLIIFSSYMKHEKKKMKVLYDLLAWTITHHRPEEEKMTGSMVAL